MRYLLLAGYLLMGAVSSASASEVHADAKTPDHYPTAPAQFRATYESLKLPQGEKMGLMGGTFLYDINNWLSLGGGGYGALAGQRGGFITIGAAAELHRQLGEHVRVNTGLFVGAGGGRGGYTLQGGGLMLRYHMGAELMTNGLGRIGGGISYVDFPDGAIHSFQPYISYSYPFEALVLPGWVSFSGGESGTRGNLPIAEQEFSVVYRRYSIPAGVLTDNGAPQHRSMGLAGVEWDRYLGDHLYMKVESEGAMQGKSNGYMQILIGAGLRLPLWDGGWLKFSGALGPAGGGAVATGGGLLLDGQLAFQQKLSDHLFAQAGLGYVVSPGASFRARSVSASMGYHFFSPDVQGDSVDAADLAGYQAHHFRIRLVNQRYLKGAPNWRAHHANLNVDLLGFQLDYFINDWFYLSGQGIGAYRGMGGGYMTGLVGAGLHLPVPGTPLFVEADALVGAAGGGGLGVGGGLVWQSDAGIGWRLSDAFSVQASYGVMQAAKGTMKAKVLSLSLGYLFTLPVL
ncbi:hypothetical protein [Mariprofundus ferrooxydans]|uniref:hypothetical protein n=1 Tax=Mariprofundus ferrooxydans TaxID=314344 RepID=UPI00128C183C|nr:hypothetical protein [Mariprofundus ferrooxydans]